MTRFRSARRDDLDAIVALLADDPLGRTRERPGDPAYAAAFEAIDADPGHELIVACDDANDARVLGVLQLSRLPSLTRTGGLRAQVEGVRVAPDARGRGLGRALLEHAVDRARDHGCILVQLTTDATRPEARAFYESLGFEASHVGMKRDLTPTPPAG